MLVRDRNSAGVDPQQSEEVLRIGGEIVSKETIKKLVKASNAFTSRKRQKKA